MRLIPTMVATLIIAVVIINLNTFLLIKHKKQIKYYKHKADSLELVVSNLTKIPYDNAQVNEFLHEGGYYMTEDSIIHFPKVTPKVVNFKIGKFEFTDNGNKIEIISPDTCMFFERWFYYLKIKNNKLKYSLDCVNWIEL